MTMPMICSLMEHGFLPVVSIERKVMLYSNTFYTYSMEQSLDSLVSPCMAKEFHTCKSLNSLICFDYLTKFHLCRDFSSILMFIKNFQSSKIFFQSNNQKEFFITCILDGNPTIIQILFGGLLAGVFTNVIIIIYAGSESQ